MTDYRVDGNLEESDRRAGTSRRRGGRGGRAAGSENEVTVRGRRKGEFIRMYTYICKYIYFDMAIHICTCTHTYMYIYKYIHIHMYICVYIYMYLYKYAYINMYI